MGGCSDSPPITRSCPDPAEELPHQPSCVLWIDFIWGRRRALLRAPMGSTFGPVDKPGDDLVDADRAGYSKRECIRYSDTHWNCFYHPATMERAFHHTSKTKGT